MAQIMNYWKYPTKGYGSSSYTHKDYGELSANFENVLYDWGQMPDELSASSSDVEKEAVSTLMFHCGVSAEMNYNPEGSGSFAYKAMRALKTHFDYGSTAALIKRSETTNSLWVASLRNEINNSRPVYYLGIDLFTAGHAWLCDGYDQDGRFHMNWGWDGNFDGFFEISLGLEVNNFDFSWAQHAIVGIAPQEHTNDGQDMVLSSAISITPNPVEAWRGFYPHYGVKNLGDSVYSGTFAVGLFDENNKFLRILNEVVWLEIQPHQNPRSIYFQTNSNDWVAPGTYYVSAVCRPTSNHHWAKLGNGDSENKTKLIIGDSAAMDEELTLISEFKIGDNRQAKQGSSFEVAFDLKNTSSINFDGGVSSILYNYDKGGRMEGYLFRDDEITIAPNQTLSRSYAISDDFGDVPAGNYLAVLYQAQDGEEYWHMANSGNFSSAIRISVSQGPDRFEPNEWTESGEYSVFRPHFENSNTYKLRPWCTSIHSVSDKDHFLLPLEAGYDYTVDAELYDSSNPEDKYTYTTDVVFFGLSSEEDGSLKYYDDVMPLPMKIENGGYAFFGVRGWGTETGSYKLEVNVTRHERGQIDSNDPRNVVTPLYRFYRKGNDSHFFTVTESEKEAVDVFWDYEGISQHVLHSMVPSATPVYRMFNNVSKSHFYTASEAELSNIQQNLSHVYSLEGIAFYALKYPVYNAKPVYRFYSPKTASHFFTISETEKDQIIQTIPETDLKYDGIAWYAFH